MKLFLIMLSTVIATPLNIFVLNMDTGAAILSAIAFASGAIAYAVTPTRIKKEKHGIESIKLDNGKTLGDYITKI